MKPTDYWRGNARLEHITPRGQRFPEVGLFAALQQVCRGHVFELGCGDGRLAPAFAPEGYTGMDINPAALARARQANPGHRFIAEWEAADTVLAYTVLLHLADEDLPAMLGRLQAYPRIVIGEIMGRQWRTPGVPPVFNRERAEYEAILGPAREVVRVPYPHYATELELCAW